MNLSELPRRTPATVDGVQDQDANDSIARRLRELGFVDGERVEVLACGPFGAEPLLVQIGFTRFALRRAEAARVRVRAGAPVVANHTANASSAVKSELKQAAEVDA